MDRRRIGIVAAGLVLFGGVIVVLRTTGADGDGRTIRTVAPPTSLKPYAVEGVVLPAKGARPERPRDLKIQPGHHRLQLAWSGDAAGYEVRWGDRTRFVTRPAVQLDGLANGTEQRVEVRAVDTFGQRSDPVDAVGTPAADTTRYTFADRFDGPVTPDPTRWRLGKRTDCARATAGDGDDKQRLVISNSCATNVVSLRSRTPFVLADGPELGRFIVQTDAPGTGGQLLLDLVPGPVSLQSGAVPPGAIRFRVSTDATGNTAAELFPAGTTRPVPPARPGLSSRWEIVLRQDGVRVLRDGTEVATSTTVPQWREATALVGVAALAGTRARAGVDLIAFQGRPAETPPLVPSPPLAIDVGGSAPSGTPHPLTGVAGGQLRLTLVPADASDPNLSVLVGKVLVPLRPAVPGSQWQPDTEYSAVADLPPEALAVYGRSRRLPVNLQTTARIQIAQADLELTPGPGTPPAQPSSTRNEPLSGQRAVLAEPEAELLDAGGQAVPGGTAFPRGRIVLDVRLDGLLTNAAGLAGFDVRLDDNRIATVATTADGPGIAGRWRIGLNTTAWAPGAHTIEIRAFSTDPATRSESAHVPFLLKS